MWNKFVVGLIVSVSFLVLSSVTSATALTATFTNSNVYQFDTNGNAIDSTSGKIDFLGGAYVWYGISFGCGSAFCGIISYSSPDLKTWQNNGFLFDPNKTEINTLCSLPGNCGRPHIIYNEASKKYVLWVNAGSPGYVIFTSSSPTSGYTPTSTRASIGYAPPASQGGDFSVAVINGTGYLAYSSIDFSTLGASIWPPFLQSIYVQQLTPDFLNTTGSAYHVFSNGDLVDFEAESPDIFKRGNYYYISASNTCGFCTGTLLVMYRSKSIQGPWTRQILSSDTCGGQSTGVLTLLSQSGGSSAYLHEADMFSTSPITGIRTAAHGHQFQALNFNADGSVQDLDCSSKKQFIVPIISGNVTSITGRAVSATDSSGEAGSFKVICDLPYNSLYQTWASSKTGILSEVGVNIAGDAPTANLSITIFRYQNNSNFFTPRYVLGTLTSVSIVPANISQALEVIRVSVGVAVKAGDRLGIALVNLGITPMCRMATYSGQSVFDMQKSTRTLFANGANQVSYRGMDGKTPPVHVLPGQEIKWYAIVS